MPEILNHFEQTFSLPLENTRNADEFLLQTELNDEQKNFCKEPSRKIRLLAPAGSGKTNSLLYRCVTQQYLNGESSAPLRFLIFTFTKAAQQELESRLRRPEFFSLRGAAEISTLNSWGFGIVQTGNSKFELLTDSRKTASCLQYDLQDVWAKYSFIRRAMTEKKLRFSAPKDLIGLIDEFKSFGFRHDVHLDRERFLAHAEWLCDNGMIQNLIKILETLNQLGIIGSDFEFPTSFNEIYENFFGFWCEAVTSLFERGKLTYEDQKYWALIKIEKQISNHENRRENSLCKVPSENHFVDFGHILIDEFQDINVLDLNLLKVIARLNKTSLCVIGDDDQSIYGWRGATQKFLLTPDNHIAEDYKSILFGVNYRSPKNIVDISQNLIKHNMNRVDKNISAALQENAEIIIKTLPEIDRSINYVTNEVEKLLADESIGKIALIARKRSQIIPYQIVFASRETPFYAAQDLRIFESQAFWTLLNFIKFKTLTDTEFEHPAEICEMLIKFCGSVKKYPLNKREQENLRSFLISKNPSDLRQALGNLYEYRQYLRGDNSDGLLSVSFYEKIKEFLDEQTASKAIRVANRNFEGLQQDFGKSMDDIFYTDPPFLYLSDFAARYGEDFKAFLKDIEAAIANLKNYDFEGKCPARQPKLELMTALRTKGREFDAVFILDCNQNIFPIKHAQTVDELESERRLFYVAVTRAKKRLYFIVNETMLGQNASPSQFLKEMNAEQFLT